MDGSPETGGDAPKDTTEVTTCEASENVEAVAELAADALRQEMEAEGFTPFAASTGAETVRIRQADIDRLRVSRTETPSYFDSEEELLSLDEDDPLRKAYEEGDVSAPDWSTHGLLSMFERSPYTDTWLFSRGDELVAYFVRLEGCLDEGLPPDPEPTEVLRRTARIVPKLSSVGSRTDTRSYRVREFDRDPGWARHPSSPVITRAGGLGDVLRLGDDSWMMWVNGYSGATGFLFRATSTDGVAWNFSWDAENICAFSGMPDIEFSKRDPSVLFDGLQFTMWVTIERTSPPSLPTPTYRTTSTDGLAWTTPSPVYDLEDIYGLQVTEHEGVLHAWGHDSSRAILHATSADGVQWSTPEAVVERGQSIDDVDGFGAFTPFAHRRGDSWELLYAAVYSPREGRDAWGEPLWYQMHLMSATSGDGVTWEKASRPIWNQERTLGHWESGNLGRPVAVQNGNETWVYYTGVEGGEPSVGLIRGPLL